MVKISRSVVLRPDPGVAQNMLYGIAALSKSDVWAADCVISCFARIIAGG